MKKVIEFDEKCQNCGGTGLYVGMAERDGAAIMCHTCQGTGCHKFHHEYEEFNKRVEKRGVVRVYQTNPGIMLGGKRLEDFGGMPVKEWESGLPFLPGMENRKYTCPAWWYQSADYKLQPDWHECNSALGKSFSKCNSFPTKAECWKKWDLEFGSNAIQED